MDGDVVNVFTPTETAAIRRLERLAKTWPASLTLFSAGGSLLVMKTADRDGGSINESRCVDIHGIPNDGGDPDSI
ncbi:hypothetical protein [Tessaracoccus sp.]